MKMTISIVKESLFNYCASLKKCSHVRIGAFIIYKKRIIAKGFAQYKSHPFQARFSRNEDSVFLHAENDVIKNTLRFLTLEQLTKSTMIIGRVKHSSPSGPLIFGNAKPCIGCQRAIASYDIQNVFYTNKHGKFQRW